MADGIPGAKKRFGASGSWQPDPDLTSGEGMEQYAQGQASKISRSQPMGEVLSGKPLPSANLIGSLGNAAPGAETGMPPAIGGPGELGAFTSAEDTVQMLRAARAAGQAARSGEAVASAAPTAEEIATQVAAKMKGSSSGIGKIGKVIGGVGIGELADQALGGRATGAITGALKGAYSTVHNKFSPEPKTVEWDDIDWSKMNQGNKEK